MSNIINLPPKGEIYPTTSQPKGDVQKLRFAKGQLEESTAEYDVTKPKYTLEENTESHVRKKFFVRCEVEDKKRGNKYSTSSEGESRIRSAKHEAAKKILSIRGKIYFFNEEKNTCNKTDKGCVICLDNPTT